MKLLHFLPALVLFTTVACNEDLPRLDKMTGQIRVGDEYCNWTPTDPSEAKTFDLSAGFEIKEAVGIDLAANGYWMQDPGNPDLDRSLEGILTAESSAPDVLEVFSAPEMGFALLAHKAGNVTLTFTLAGHPGELAAPVTITPSDQFVSRLEGTPPAPDGGASSSSSSSSGSSSSSSSSGGTDLDAGTDAATEGDAQ